MGRQTFQKRAIEKQRQERQAAKRARRHARQEEREQAERPDEDELLERFRRLNEARAAGEISEEQFAVEQHEILVILGVEDDD